MENSLQIFSNSEFGEIRMIEVAGASYFVGVDVARALAYSSPSKAVIDHCKGITKIGIPSAGGTQETNVIPEGDVYRLIIKAADQSRNEEVRNRAGKFESWIFDEVLPSIRKTGAYLTPAAMEQLITDPDALIIALTAYQKEKRAHAETLAAKEQLQAEAIENEPKVKLADAISATEDTILVRELAKILRGNGVEIGGRRLFGKLRDEGYLVKQASKDHNLPTQKSLELGLFVIKETIIPQSGGRMILQKTPRVTGKGQQYFVNRYLRAAEDAVLETIAV